MPEPILFVSHHRVKEGALDTLLASARQVTASIDREKPGTSVFCSYLSEDRSRVSFVHVFPDTSAMDAHFEGAAERAAAAGDLIEPEGFEVYGGASDAALQMLRSSGSPVDVHPHFAAGFLRGG